MHAVFADVSGISMVHVAAVPISGLNVVRTMSSYANSTYHIGREGREREHVEHQGHLLWRNNFTNTAERWKKNCGFSLQQNCASVYTRLEE